MGRGGSYRLAVTLFAIVATAGLCLFLAGANALASPAYPVVKEFIQPDGTPISLRLWGDEFAHGWETLDGFTVVKDPFTNYWEYAEMNPLGELVSSGIMPGKDAPPQQKHLRPSPEVIQEAREALGAPEPGMLEAAPPWAGTDTDVLFILVGFTDRPCTFTAADFQNNLFGGGATGPGDLDDYFNEISYGNLGLDGTVVGCYTLPNTHAFYDNGPGNQDMLVIDAVILADPDVDYRDFDNDGDTVVDSLGIIYAGGGPHDGCETDDGASGPGGDNLWPHSGQIPPLPTLDLISWIGPYIMQSEITYGIADDVCDEMQTIGLFAHEFGHALGLPDLYDTDNSSEGVGFWSSMASQFRSTVNLADTPPHYDPWSKWIMGWITPTNLTGQDVYASLPEASANPFAIQLLDNPGGPEEGGSGEYFLVENRQQTGFDSQLPGCGLLIWHIEESQTNNQNEGHTSASHRLVDLEEADGLDELDGIGDRGDDGDPFPGSTGNRLFHDDRYPTARAYSGAETGVRISEISDCATEMFAGIGDLPNIQVPGIVFFDETCTGVTSYATLEVCNTGRADLEVEDITSSDPQFSITEPSSGYPVIISPDFCFPFQVEFTPTSMGGHLATLSITSNDPTDPTVDVDVFGFSGEPRIATVIADGGDFGNVCLGDYKDLGLTISNSGTCPLSVSGIVSSDPAQFQTAGVMDYPLVIGAGDSLAIPIRFQPGSIGAKAATFTIASDDPTAPDKVVGVTGNTPPGDVRVTGSPEFGDVCAGTLAEKDIKVCNVGQCDLTVLSATLEEPSGAECEDFLLVNRWFPAVVSKDFCMDLVVRFTPTTAGFKTCNLIIETDDPDAPVWTVVLTANTPFPMIDVPPDIGFPPTVIQSVDACESESPFPVSNTGICNLDITDFSVESASAVDEYFLQALPSFPIILQPGHVAGEGDLRVDFRPQSLDRDLEGTLRVTYISDPVTGATDTVTRSLCGEGTYTGARVLVTEGGVPIPVVKSLKLQRLTANRNRDRLDSVDNVRNVPLQTMMPASPCASFQFHREYGTVSNPIQLPAGSYQITATARVGGKVQKRTVGFDVSACDFNPTIVVDF